jgi:hypothetical protein
VDFSGVTQFHWLAPDFLIGHPMLLRAYSMPDRSNLREEINGAFELICEGNFMPVERRRLYRQLVEKVTLCRARGLQSGVTGRMMSLRLGKT